MFVKASIVLKGLLAFLFASEPLESAEIRILTSTLAGTIANGDADDDLNSFYQGGGHSSSLITGPILPGQLVGVDLLVVMLPDAALSMAETDEMLSLAEAGGWILFIGEQHNFAASENGSVNAALGALGSSMSIETSSLGSGFANTSSDQIVDNPLTLGVDLVNYGNVNRILGVPSGNEIFLTPDLSNSWAAYERLNHGVIVLLADSNIISNIENTAANDNHAFFSNVAAFSAGSDPSISIHSMGLQEMEVTFTGIIQGSDALGHWTDLDPQPASPWKFTPLESTQFFRARSF